MKLKEARNLTGMKQKEVAEKTGIPLGTLRRWEQGVNEPDTDSLVLLADLYGVSTDVILGSSFSSKNEVQQLSADERELIRLFRSCDQRGREYMMQMAEVTATIFADKQ